MTDRWPAVGRHIEERIATLDLTYAEVIRLSGVSDKTLAGYIAGRPIKRRDKKRELCRALGWSPDSIERILQGGEPIETAPDEPATPEEALALIRDLILSQNKLEARISHLQHEVDELRGEAG